MADLDVERIYEVLNEHWCDEFPYGESCKHCSLELKICNKIDSLFNEKDEEQ